MQAANIWLILSLGFGFIGYLVLDDKPMVGVICFVFSMVSAGILTWLHLYMP